MEDYLKDIKESRVQGRYVTLDKVLPILQNFKSFKVIGQSVEGRNVYGLTIGKGKNKVLMWSQMHGNEATTTKAVLDLLKFLGQDTEASNSILQQCTLFIIPILNPDGALAYTRMNAKDVDLNRDATKLEQPESRILRKTFEQFAPDFCFNLHDQRTIYNVEGTHEPATVSFLSPASDESRTITPARKIAMQLIGAMNRELQIQIPGRVGRYDDSFNPNCVGDRFQMFGVPTILFEAGHSPDDYQREETRRYVYTALKKVLQVISTNDWHNYTLEEYHSIPQNDKKFMDVIIDNVHSISDRYSKGESVGILFDEILENDEIKFRPRIEKAGDLKGYLGHKQWDASNPEDLKKLQEYPEFLSVIK